STGRDIKFDLNRTEGFRNFCNKIWNASRYVLMNTEEKGIAFNQAQQDAIRAANQFSLADRWILSRFQRTVQQVHEQMASYRFDLVSQAVYDFFWNEYCDWYLELSKPVLWDESASPAQKNATRWTLLSVLEQSLRLAHPLMPFITEEIWLKAAPMLGISSDSIMLQAWPEQVPNASNAEVEAEITWLQGLITAIRNIRGELNVSPAKTIPVLLNKAGEQDRAWLDQNRQALRKLAKLDSIECLEPGASVPPAAMQLSGALEILVPLAGLVDVKAETARLAKEI